MSTFNSAMTDGDSSGARAMRDLSRRLKDYAADLGHNPERQFDIRQAAELLLHLANLKSLHGRRKCHWARGGRREITPQQQSDLQPMTVTKHPAPGTIVRVDLSEGFRPPEMVKRRPAIVLSPPIPGRNFLCTIVPLSTTAPVPQLAHHMQISLNPPLPHPYSERTMWVKGDIVLTVAFHRLRYLFSGKDERRNYEIRVLDQEIMNKVRSCVRAGLGL
jgi:mRNA interferase MazF